MDKVRALIQQAERDAALGEAVAHVLSTLRLLHMGRLEVEETSLIIDLRDDMQRLVAALTLLGYSSGE